MQKNPSQILIIILLLTIPLMVIASAQEYELPNIIPNYSGVHYGFSSYPKTESQVYTNSLIDDMIQEMDQNGLTIYRMSFNDYVPSETVITHVQYYLDNCDHEVIVDYYHQYPMGALSTSDLEETTKQGLEIADAFNNNPRVWLEPFNERTNSNLDDYIQSYVDDIRDEGYTYKIVVNKWDQTWTQMASVNDPLDKFYSGYHFYFNSGSWSTAESQMQTALDKGIKLINTEIGADYNEYREFSLSEVQRVNEFCEWCEQKGVGNTIWMRYGLGNYAKYIELGLINPLTGNELN